VKSTRRFLRSKHHLWLMTKGAWIMNQPWIMWIEEISIEEAKRRFGHIAPVGAVSVKPGLSSVLAHDPRVDTEPSRPG
jgi:hypothetical protein